MGGESTNTGLTAIQRDHVMMMRTQGKSVACIVGMIWTAIMLAGCAPVQKTAPSGGNPDLLSQTRTETDRSIIVRDPILPEAWCIAAAKEKNGGVMLFDAPGGNSVVLDRDPATGQVTDIRLSTREGKFTFYYKLNGPLGRPSVAYLSDILKTPYQELDDLNCDGRFDVMSEYGGEYNHYIWLESRWVDARIIEWPAGVAETGKGRFVFDLTDGVWRSQPEPE